MENFGGDTVVITACDDTGYCESVLYTIQIGVDCDPDLPVNDLSAIDDYAGTGCSQSLVLQVLANDTYPSGTVICDHSVPMYGSVTLIGNDLLYSPADGYQGSDSFYYTICNDDMQDTGTVSINIGGNTNQPPQVVPDSYVANSVPITLHPLTNDGDPNGDSIYICEVDNPTAGSISQVGNDILYTPPTDFFGEAILYYQVCDDNNCGSLTNLGQITISVNSLDTNDCDDTPISLCTQPMTLVLICPDFCYIGEVFTIVDAYTTFSCSVVVDSDCVFYNPLPGLPLGSVDSVYIVACNPLNVCDTVLAYISIQENCDANNPPVATDDFETSDGGPVPIDVLENDYDIDGDDFFICSYTNPSNGTIIILNNEFVYTPNSGFSGCDDFTYSICEVNVPTNQSTAVVTVCTDQSCHNQTLMECTELMTPIVICPDFCALSGSYTLGNIISEFGNNISMVGSDCFRYTPVAGYAGLEILMVEACATTVDICDDIIVEINIVEDCDANLPPVANDDVTSTTSGTPVAIFYGENDYDQDSEYFYVCSYGNPLYGTVYLDGVYFVYTPNTGFFGEDQFEYQICDEQGLSDIATVSISVSGSLAFLSLGNDEFYSTDIGVLLPFTANDFIPSACGEQVFTIANSPTYGSLELNEDGLYFYRPDGINTIDVMSYEICACGSCETAFVKIFVDYETSSCMPMIPNAFSPNGDGINDIYEIPELEECNLGKNFEWSIFDRYGRGVYKEIGMIQDGAIHWNGQDFYGKKQVSGTYYYILYISDPVDPVKKKGFIELKN